VIALQAVRWSPPGTPGAPGRLLLDGFDLTLATGKVTAILGPSGCGKSTLVRLLAGLRVPDAGTIAGLPERKAMVFQDAALLPWRTLRENVALPGEFGPIGDVDEALAAVGLTEHAEKLPRQLSGGQRMRGSLARALVARAELVLLDEAFGALDGLTRASVQDAVEALSRAQGWTVVMVTHEPADAARLADRIVLVDGPPLRVVADMTLEGTREARLAAVSDAIAQAWPARGPA
jgi:ABC-type nitrate/sulfonate/bicarbonate transport system ATPase subunit